LSEKANISVSKCEIELLDDPKPYRGRPLGELTEAQKCHPKVVVSNNAPYFEY